MQQEAVEHKLINRLSCLAYKLRTGQRCHVTGLMPISRLNFGDHTCKQYFMFLVNASRQLLIEGSSLSTVNVVDEEKKTKLLDSGIALLTEYYRSYGGILRVGKELIDLHNEIYMISPGVKRIAIHADRRKLEDADLLLMEKIIWFSLNHAYKEGTAHCGFIAYYASQTFISDCTHMRYNLDYRSAARVEEIIKFWSKNLRRY